MALTDPGTRSPGRMVIEYQTLGIEHLASAWLLEGVNIDASIDDLRGVAISFASALMDSCPNTSFAHTWNIVDPDGVNLFAENYDTSISGTHTSDGAITSQSVQVTVTGKGTPPTIGVAKGFTRTSIFTGLFNTTYELSKDFIIVADETCWDLVQLLRDNLFIGADKFGQKATYASRELVQINGHWQRNYGL